MNFPARFEGPPQQLQFKMVVEENAKACAIHAEIPCVKKEKEGEKVSI